MKRLPVSVAIIARNEAHNLPRCLESVQEWVSEIVLLINDCTDATRSVAEQYGARVVEGAWSNHRDQKNKCLALATQPWILSLDADEAVPPDLRAEIVQFFAGEHDRYSGGRFSRRTWFMGRWITHGDWYPDCVTRLFRNGQARFVGDPTHDRAEVEGPVKRFRYDLLHYCCPSISDHLRKIEYYVELEVRKARAAGKRWRMADTLIRPFWRFFRAYVLRGGFLDGFPGLYIAVAIGFDRFLRYARLYEAEKLHLQLESTSLAKPAVPTPHLKTTPSAAAAVKQTS